MDMSETINCIDCGFYAGVDWENDETDFVVDELSFCPNCGSSLFEEDDDDDAIEVVAMDSDDD